MPDYTIRDPQSGKTLTVRGDSPPTEGELESLFAASAPGKTPAPAAVAPSSDLSRMHMMGAWMASPDSGAAAQRGLSLAADAATKAMPTAGGILGGALGGVPGALLGGAAGEAYRQLLQRLRGKPDEGTATGAAGDIATAGAVQGAAQAVGAVAQPLLEKAGQGLMQTALKPGMKALRTVMTGKDAVPPVVQTLLDEGVNVTPGGLEKLRGLIESDNASIKALIANPNANLRGGGIPALQVASRLNAVAADRAMQVAPEGDLAAVTKAGQEFLNHPAIDAHGTISLTDAQAMKVGTYKNLSGKYGQPNAQASIDAEKALARGLKEEIAQHVPAVDAINAHEGRLINALEQVGRRVALSGNKDPIGFAWVAHNPTTFLAALIDRSPAVKSLLARGLYSSAGNAARVSPLLIRGAVLSLAQDTPVTEDAAQTPASNK